MTTQIAPIQDSELPEMPMSPYTQDDKAWGGVVTSAAFLPRVQLYGGSSDACKEGKIGIGHFGLVKGKDSMDSLGNTFDCLPISWRFKAMDMSDKGAIICCYNPKAAEFLRIQGAAGGKDSNCVFGVEFLIWLPSQGIFATLYMNNPTSRRVAPDLKNLLGKQATIKSTLIVTPKFKWHGPVVTQCSTPFEFPDSQAALEEATKFASPKESEIEKVSADSGSARPQ